MGAHNWVVLGALLDNPRQPPSCLPLWDGSISGNPSCLFKPRTPITPWFSGPNGRLVVELIREQGCDYRRAAPGPLDGAYALRSVVRPLVQPGPGHPRIEFLTRFAAGRSAVRPAATRVSANQKWGRRLPPPCQGGRWSGPWQEGEGFIYGRQRQVRWKGQVCLWWVAGAEVPVKVVVAEVEGYRQRFHLGQFGDRVDRRGDGGRVCGAVPPGGRVPGPQERGWVGKSAGPGPRPRSSGPARSSG